MATTNISYFRSSISSSKQNPPNPSLSSSLCQSLSITNHTKTSFILSCKNQKPTSDFIVARNQDDDFDDKLREKFGVAGIYGDPEASRLCYLALHALQHRGQEGDGVFTVDKGEFMFKPGVGLVSEVLNESELNRFPGDSAIGHVRYSTVGSSMLKNVQPFIADCKFGEVGVAHNGNFVNYFSLRAKLEEIGAIFNSSSDTEVVLIAHSKASNLLLSVIDACEHVKGAYSLVFVTKDKLVAVRDPHGFRPLVISRRSNGSYVFGSETCALDLIEATCMREKCILRLSLSEELASLSIFIFLRQIQLFLVDQRREFGEILATKTHVDCDVVIAVPDSGVVAALAYAA
ncbi:hypothetical protein C5167_024126 [Papaver somniferum]|uniref:Glutamine amidotransferase type-2 domain-containing protein n=1 Tax=Papaver somniferum TaxID=3469 RepID=A0A4Y7JQM3_PAPSO|nr:hypothetical protein C5167_024126 [Papaver somniferum]